MLDKFILSLFFGCFVGFAAVAEMSPSIQFVPQFVNVEIWLKTPSGELESPEMKIVNVTENCEVHAQNFGRAEVMAIRSFKENEQVLDAQVVNVNFDSCPLFFGRLHRTGAFKSQPDSALLGTIHVVSPNRIEVFYEPLLTEDQMIKLNEALGTASTRPSSDGTSLVLKSTPSPAF